MIKPIMPAVLHGQPSSSVVSTDRAVVLGVWRYRGKTYAMATNTSSATTDANFTAHGLKRAQAIGGHAMTMSNGGFNDTLGAYASRVYVGS